MIEKIVLDYLNGKLPVPAYMETPIDIPNEYVLIQRTGGGETNKINNAQMAIQAISSRSLYNAASLCELVNMNMDVITDETDISSCKRNSTYNFTDTDTKEYRYQSVFDIYY